MEGIHFYSLIFLKKIQKYPYLFVVGYVWNGNEMVIKILSFEMNMKQEYMWAFELQNINNKFTSMGALNDFDDLEYWFCIYMGCWILICFKPWVKSLSTITAWRILKHEKCSKICRYEIFVGIYKIFFDTYWN